MFWVSSSFNQDISDWNISSAERLRWMFGHARFNPNIAHWDVSRVTDLYQMFDSNSFFQQDLCAWGQKLPRDAYVLNAFAGASLCPFQQDPNLSAKPPGPFCYQC